MSSFNISLEFDNWFFGIWVLSFGIFKMIAMRRNIIKITLLVLSICVYLPTIQAQNNSLKKADKHYELYAFRQAIPLYEEVMRSSPNNYDAASRLAECYRQIGDMGRARQWYAKATENPNVDPVDIFYYAQVLRSEGRYSEAKARFLQYAKSDPELGNHYAGACDYALSNAAGDSQFGVSPTSNINSVASDFAPAFYINQLMFSTFRRGNGNDNDAFNQLYISMRSNNQLARPQPLRKDFQAIINEGSPSFTDNGRRVAYVKNNNKFSNGIVPLMGSGAKLDIYLADAASQNDWQNEEAFPYNGRKYSNGYPYLTPEGNTLYFASDVPGGYGGFDIYICERIGSDWSEPTNLGPAINTGGDEISPFLAGTTLYFSSNWHDGYGGLDIFKSVNINGEWKQAVNMGKGINSPRDDYDFIYKPYEKIAYFTSNRAGGLGYDDIYQAIAGATTPPPTTGTPPLVTTPPSSNTPPTTTLPPNTAPPTTTTPSGSIPDRMTLTVLDEVTKQPLDGVQINLTACNGSVYNTDVNGIAILERFTDDCTIRISKSGYGESLHRFPMLAQLQIGLTPIEGAFTGIVMDSESEARLSGVLVTATDKKTQSTVTATTDARGRYALQLSPDSEYTLSYSKTGYVGNARLLNTRSQGYELGFHEMEVAPYFDPGSVVVVPTTPAPQPSPPQTTQPRPQAPVVIQPPVVVQPSTPAPAPPTIITTPPPTTTTTTTTGKAYEVQIGAFSAPRPGQFRNLESIGSVYYDTKNGLAIYKVGTFGNYRDAERARAAVRNNGYPDAFIRRASRDAPVYTPPTTTITSPTSPSGTVYKIQLGAFRNPNTAGFNPSLQNFGTIQQITRTDGITVFLLGDFYSMTEAAAAQENAKNLGVSQAFIVKYRNGVRVK